MNKIATKVARLLVLSCDSAIIGPLRSIGESNGWRIEVTTGSWKAIERTQSGEPLTVVILDLPRGSAEDLLCLGRLRRMRPELPIILIGYAEDDARRQEGLRIGARDFLVRPVREWQIETAIRESLSTPGEGYGLDIASEDVEPVGEGNFFIGVSPTTRRLRAQAALLAETNVPVMIVGEAGTGRETVARLIHKLSVRSGFPFGRVNCAALPEELLERELFGRDIGGINGSLRNAAGKLELSTDGTIFLDEITAMPMSLQSGLMKVIENRRFTRPGSSDVVDADVRIVAASCNSVDRAITEGWLSEQLSGRLGAYTIYVPPLRDRKDELSLLACHFMHRIAKRYGLAPRGFSPAIVGAWQSYNWPGNLQELEHRVKRYLIVGDDELAMAMPPSIPDVKPAHNDMGTTCREEPRRSLPNRIEESAAGSKSLRSLIQSVRAEAERNAIAAALEKTGWNRKAAARLLDISYRNVLYKIEQYSLSSSNS